MNSKRIVFGGLTAAVVLMIGEIGVEPLMKSSTDQFFHRLNLPLPGESATIAIAAGVLALGLLSVWLYAALVPALGAGSRTACLVGVIVWSLSCLLPNVTMLVFGLLDTRLFLIWNAWPLVESVVATVAGAAVHDRRAVRSVARGLPDGA